MMGSAESREIRWQYGHGIRSFLRAADSYEKGGSDTPINDAVNSTTADLARYSDTSDLPRLLYWARNLLTQKIKLDRDLMATDRRAKAAESRNSALVAQLKDTQAAVKREMEQRRMAEAQAEAEKQDMEQQHKRAVAQLTTAHSQQMQETHQLFDRQMRVQQGRFNEQAAGLEREIKKLQGQLLVSHDKNLAWPDEKLKIRLGEVRRLIDNATARLASTNLVPGQVQLNARLDPAQTRLSVGGKTHFWLRSAIWTIIQSSFFSLPFGFGALGPDAGVAELLAVYSAWRARVDGRTDLNPRDGQTFDIFRQSPLSNKWRSVTFQSLALSILGDGMGGGSMPAGGVVARLGEQNVDACARRIMSLLSELSALSRAPLYSGLEEEVRNMSQLAFEIALQFGVNQASLSLQAAALGETVVIGPEFQDCEDGEEHRGTRAHVGFIVSPGLVRIGDGRSELTKKHIVLPCEIFAADEA